MVLGAYSLNLAPLNHNYDAQARFALLSAPIIGDSAVYD